MKSRLVSSPRLYASSLILLLVILSALPVAVPRAASNDLAAKVTIRRDNFGVPHILAPTEEAAAYGHGYVTAEDHVLELARLLLKARSEEALYFGDKFAD